MGEMKILLKNTHCQRIPEVGGCFSKAFTLLTNKLFLSWILPNHNCFTFPLWSTFIIFVWNINIFQPHLQAPPYFLINASYRFLISIHSKRNISQSVSAYAQYSSNTSFSVTLHITTFTPIFSCLHIIPVNASEFIFSIPFFFFPFYLVYNSSSSLYMFIHISLKQLTNQIAFPHILRITHFHPSIFNSSINIFVHNTKHGTILYEMKERSFANT